MKVIAVASGKGGVGKSTVSVNLAVALQKRGARVGLLDADIYGPSQPGMLGVEKDQQLDIDRQMLKPMKRHGVQFVSMGVLMASDGPVIWRAPMAMKIIHQFLQNVEWGELDYLVIDLPPGTGDVQLTLAQQAKLTGAVIVTTPQEVAVGVAKKGLKMFQQVKVPILGVIENMSGFECENCNHVTHLFSQGGGEKLAKEMNVEFLGAIPLDQEIVKSADSGKPLAATDSKSKARQAYDNLAERVEASVVQAANPNTTGEPQVVELNKKGNLNIQWPDGKVSELSPFELRVNCVCASCVDENSGKQILMAKNVSEKIGIKDVFAVGRYALGMKFSDGHSTGIYTFERLRALSYHKERGDSLVPPAARGEAPAGAHVANAQGSVSAAKTSASNDLGPEAQQIQKVLDERINPGVAGHGGRISLVDYKDNTAYVKMSGGCQGCSQSKATLTQGVERAIKELMPNVVAVKDVTDHSAGQNPYYN